MAFSNVLTPSTPSAPIPQSSASPRPPPPESAPPPSCSTRTAPHPSRDPNRHRSPPSTQSPPQSPSPSRAQSSDTSPPASLPNPRSPLATPHETASSHFLLDTQSQTETDPPPSYKARPEREAQASLPPPVRTHPASLPKFARAPLTRESPPPCPHPQTSTPAFPSLPQRSPPEPASARKAGSHSRTDPRVSSATSRGPSLLQLLAGCRATTPQSHPHPPADPI